VTLKEERDYYKQTVHEIADSMDRTAIELFVVWDCLDYMYECIKDLDNSTRVKKALSDYKKIKNKYR